MQCKSCRKEIVDGAAFCKHCGFDQSGKLVEPPLSGTPGYHKVIMVLSCVVALLAGYWGWKANSELRQLQAAAANSNNDETNSTAATKGYEVTALFENVGNLKKESPVKSAGVTVGKVQDLVLDPVSYEAKVVMALDKKYTFPKDTIAAIATDCPQASSYVALKAGGEESVLSSGDTIIDTQKALSVEEMVSAFLYDKATKKLD